MTEKEQAIECCGQCRYFVGGSHAIGACWAFASKPKEMDGGGIIRFYSTVKACQEPCEMLRQGGAD